jgi:hypothetical protein
MEITAEAAGIMEWLLTRIAGSISNGHYATEGHKVFASVPRLPAELVAGR